MAIRCGDQVAPLRPRSPRTAGVKVHSHMRARSSSIRRSCCCGGDGRRAVGARRGAGQTRGPAHLALGDFGVLPLPRSLEEGAGRCAAGLGCDMRREGALLHLAHEELRLRGGLGLRLGDGVRVRVRVGQLRLQALCAELRATRRRPQRRRAGSALRARRRGRLARRRYIRPARRRVCALSLRPCLLQTCCGGGGALGLLRRIAARHLLLVLL